MKPGFNPNSLKNLVPTNRGPKPRINAVTQHRFLLALLDGATVYQISEETGLGYTAAGNYLRALHKPAEGINLVYISSWEPDNRGAMSLAVFKWGPGKSDVTKPRMTSSERSRRYRAKILERSAMHGITNIQPGGEA